ncbi:MAG TPA: hypothetical protein VGK11_08375 [Actinomycetota bacterium]|jgi:hypothetical protein
MNSSRMFRTPRHLVTVLGATLVVAGAGVALARTSSGPPWAQESPSCAEATGDTTTVVTDTVVSTDVGGTADCVELDKSQVQEKVEGYFQAVGHECGTAVLGKADLSNPDTATAFDALVTALDSGQKDHMVQSVRVLMANCAAHPNDGLKNALYHHGLNWVRHYEHEQWLQQKFAGKWPDGKPGKPDNVHGKPDKVHGNPHDLAGATSGSHGHGNGQVEGS